MTRPLPSLRVLAPAFVALGLAGFASTANAIGPPPPTRPIDRASPTTGPDGSPLTAEDQAELKQMEEAVRQFEAATRDYRGTISYIIRQDYERKRREIAEKYDGKIKIAEEDEKKRRLDAIAAFEAWLKRYPNDQRWTPDVIFRLAELYFERSNDDYLAAVDASQKAAEAAQKKAAAAGQQAESVPEAPPSPDYTLTIALYQRLIREFSGYRLIDGAYYLLGYCQGEMGKEAEAKQAWLALVCENQYKALDTPSPPQPTKSKSGAFVDPYVQCKAIKDDSRFVPEAWTRIGEYHFDSNELEMAIAAYARVLKYKDSPYFDKALYKLAWSYYRADKYPEAIKNFDDLVVFSDVRKSESGKEGSDLRQEAIQYLGISFAEKDWNGDTLDDTETSLQRIEAFYRGREKEPHVREVYKKLGDIHFDETEYNKAIAVYRALIAKWPYDKDNFKEQDKIVDSFKRLRDKKQELEAIEKAAKEFGPNSTWAGRQDKVTRDAAAAFIEEKMITVAVEHHKAAQTLKKLALEKKPPDPVMIQRVLSEYQLAADGYKNYLSSYPNSKNTYEYSFYLAETLYWSSNFAEAAAQYEKVRDSNLDNRYMEDAAFNAVKSYEKLVDKDIAERKYGMPPIPEVGKVKAPVTPLPVPDEVRKLQTAYDAFAQRLPQSGRSPTMQYKAAEIDFKYLDFPRARPRMEDVFSKYCKEDIGGQAGTAIVATWTIENDYDKILEWTEKLTKGGCGGTKFQAENTGKLEDLKSDVRFKKALKDFEDGKFEQAAEAFVKIVDADPQNKSKNNDKALYNAAVGFEKVSRFQAATKLFERIVGDYPESPFLDEALFRTAVNYQKYFEFDKAVVAYQRLAVDPRFAKSPNRQNALFNAAVLLESDQAYAEAAKLFQQYSKEPSTKPEEAADAYFKSGLIHLKNKDPQRAIKTFEEFLKIYGNGKDPKKEIEARYRIAEAYEQQKNKGAALREYAKIADEGARVAPASDAAEFPAKAAFLLAEQELPALEKLKMSGDPKKLDKELTTFQAEIKRLKDLYERAITYKRATWALAGFYRIGYSFELLSRALGGVANAPCPAEIKKKFKDEGCDLYLQQLSSTIEKMVAPIDEEVVKRYRITLDQAARFGASNEWTRQARIRANAYKPDEFPLVKDERVELQLESPIPPDPPAGGSPDKPGSDPAPDTKQAQTLLLANRFEEAITSTKRALSRDERYVPAMIVMAKAYFQLKKYELATAIVQIAQGIEANNAEGWNLLGHVALTRDDRIAAAASFKKAVEAKPDYGNAWNSLCAKYVEAKNWDAALEAGEKATQLLPAFAKAHLNLASAYRGKGRYTDAENENKRALQLNPSYAEAYFNNGILYLDAPAWPGLDVIGKLNIAINQLSRYRDMMASRLTPEDPAEGYMEEARKSIERERKRLERAAKQKEREKAKQPAPAPGDAPGPAPGDAPGPTPGAVPPAPTPVPPPAPPGAAPGGNP